MLPATRYLSPLQVFGTGKAWLADGLRRLPSDADAWPHTSTLAPRDMPLTHTHSSKRIILNIMTEVAHHGYSLESSYRASAKGE